VEAPVVEGASTLPDPLSGPRALVVAGFLVPTGSRDSAAVAMAKTARKYAIGGSGNVVTFEVGDPDNADIADTLERLDLDRTTEALRAAMGREAPAAQRDDDDDAPVEPLAGSHAYSGFAVDDVPAARAFYADVLGLDVSEQNGMLTLHPSSHGPTLIYPKPDHVPATFTVLNFPVADIRATVDALSARGVEFLRYDGMEQDERGIMTGQGPLIAWFLDPAGNVLSVLES
jgi:catechol 2,3-dioxygenase-like lactoylglutathione lyase family enzyme